MIVSTLPAFAACTVQQIEIVTGGMSDVFCTRVTANVVPGCTVPTTPPPFTCEGTSFAIQCPLGPFVPGDGLNFMGLAFEVRATLTGDSNPADCTQGQFVQSTTTLGGNLQDNPPSQPSPTALPAGLQAAIDIQIVTAPTIIPQLGASVDAQPLYGADNFVTLLNEGGVGAGVLYWIDAPSIGVDGETIVEQNRFISFVAGSTGTPADSAWCAFLVQRTFGTTVNETLVASSTPASNCVVQELPGAEP